MNPIRFAIEKPVTVLVGVILVALFGAVSVLQLPVQLTPSVEKPLITVTTFWEGASPQEVEREIIDKQEEKLKGIQGLYRMNSSATRGSATINLEFRVGKDISRALLDTSERLRQVTGYPENVEEPIVRAGEWQGASAIAWFILRRRRGSLVASDKIAEYQTLLEEQVKPRVEQAEGVASVDVIGGVEREVHVKVDPFKLAARGLSLLDVRNAIQSRNIDVSAGNLELGKRDFTIRTVGKFAEVGELESLVLARRGGNAVYLRDVGSVSRGFKEHTRIVRSRGTPAIAMNATRQAGTNVIEVMDAVKTAIRDVNRDILARDGLELVQVYDETAYIYSAIDLVMQNLWVGGLLAIMMLLVFLREGRSTLIVALAIPISVVGAFLGLWLLGRNLNVISLAGLAFAVGMVVDASIVVLENVYRHRQLGEKPFEAAWNGAREVWGAVLASTLTTLAVFIPVVFVQEEAGQLFRDIAIAISSAVFLSLLVSVIFIPMVAARLPARPPAATGRRFGLRAFGRRFTEAVCAGVAFINTSVTRGLLTVIGLTGAAVLLSWLLVPPTTYLPAGNQNLVFGFIIAPPGLNMTEWVRMGKQIEGRLEPYWSVAADGRLPPDLESPAWYEGRKPIPAIENFFFVALPSNAFLGAASVDDDNVAPLKDLLGHATAELPGVMVFANQRSLFQRGLSTSNSIDLEVTGYDFAEINNAALALMGAIARKLGFPQPDPPNFHLGGPEIRVVLDEERATELGLNVRDLGFIVRSMVDGAKVSEFRDAGVNIDVKLMPVFPDERPFDTLAELPIFTPAQRQVPLSAVAGLEETIGPSSIRHFLERRSVKLIVRPPQGIEISTAMTVLEDDILGPMRRQGTIPDSVTTFLSGTADKLVSTREALQWNLLLAIAITFLLMAALFESFLYPLVIMFSVPLAAVGGIIGLRLANVFAGQQLDILTMLGFVILVGTVVNNAILIVHQALNNIREQDMKVDEAILESVRTRVRPIFMSTATSVLGMTPLVLFPGAGSELYRGVGSVVVGGLIASTVFTLFVVPALFRLVLVGQRWAGAGFRLAPAEAASRPAPREGRAKQPPDAAFEPAE